jgi:polyvinyl alcohol dehydrogenase (cytochrome)
MSPENVLAAHTSGVMQPPALSLSPLERRTVAEYLTGKIIGGEAPSVAKDGACKASSDDLTISGSMWNGWGVDATNTRYQFDPGFSASDVPKLKLKWAYALPGAVSISPQPVIVDNVCTFWEFKADAPMRAAITIAKPDGASRWLAKERRYAGLAYHFLAKWLSQPNR